MSWQPVIPSSTPHWLLYPNSSFHVCPLVCVPWPRLCSPPRLPFHWSLALSLPLFLPTLNPWTLCYPCSLPLDPFKYRINRVRGFPRKEPLQPLYSRRDPPKCSCVPLKWRFGNGCTALAPEPCMSVTNRKSFSHSRLLDLLRDSLAKTAL